MQGVFTPIGNLGVDRSSLALFAGQFGRCKGGLLIAVEPGVVITDHQILHAQVDVHHTISGARLNERLDLCIGEALATCTLIEATISELVLDDAVAVGGIGGVTVEVYLTGMPSGSPDMKRTQPRARRAPLDRRHAGRDCGHDVYSREAPQRLRVQQRSFPTSLA